MAEVKKSEKIYLPPCIGVSTPLLLNLFRENKVHKGFHSRRLFTSMISGITSPFRAYERLRFDSKIERFEIKQDPVFILGHWRSGTTFLHNLMCQDPQFSFVTTYQGVFPEVLLSSGLQGLFKSLMKRTMPKTRLGDNVKLSADYPQEEEFALGCRMKESVYNFWFFPDKTMEFVEKSLMPKTAEHRAYWKKEYLRFVKKTILNQRNLRKVEGRFISKNPPHTARADLMLELFPNAKFIHIYRNPITVFLSTRNFFRKMMPPLAFQEVDDEALTNNIISTYKMMMEKHLADRELIPSGQYTEVRFETLEKNVESELSRIYKTLNIPGLDSAMPAILTYAESKKSYKKNVHSIETRWLEKVQKEWAFSLNEFNYQVPDNVKIIP